MTLQRASAGQAGGRRQAGQAGGRRQAAGRAGSRQAAAGRQQAGQTAGSRQQAGGRQGRQGAGRRRKAEGRRRPRTRQLVGVDVADGADDRLLQLVVAHVQAAQEVDGAWGCRGWAGVSWCELVRVLCGCAVVGWGQDGWGDQRIGTASGSGRGAATAKPPLPIQQGRDGRGPPAAAAPEHTHARREQQRDGRQRPPAAHPPSYTSTVLSRLGSR